jgi:hypothetical protein
MSRLEVPLAFRMLRATGDLVVHAELVLAIKTDRGAWELVAFLVDSGTEMTTMPAGEAKKRNVPMPKHPLSWYLAAFALFCPWSASATTIDPLLFEELVLGADFVGIVECEQAGGIVAAYTVVESWKGPKHGTRITIRVAVNYWEPQFPITLCGERYFVTAYKEAPFRMMSTTSGGPVPLWWRNIPAEYSLPLFQGRKLLAPGEEKGVEFQKTRKVAQTLLALKPAEQETALLKAVIENDLFGEKWIGGEPDKAKAKEIRARLAKLTTADALVAELIRMATEQPQQWEFRAHVVLGKAGGPVALASLQRLPRDRSPWDKNELDKLIRTISRRHGTKIAAPSPTSDTPGNEQAPSGRELANLRRAVARGAEAEGFAEAFEILTRHDPGPVVEFLVAWMNPNQDSRDKDRGYALGSYFAWRCGKDRKKHLAAVSVAKDPFIRVAGAVYLCFEDSEAGTAALKRMTAVDGDAGAWAALTLARRGHKDAVPRALEVFRDLPPADRHSVGSMADVPHRNLQKRVLVLLSNSARAGGAPQPAPPGQPASSFDSLLNWWKEHGDKLVLNDPWLAILEKQKVD